MDIAESTTLLERLRKAFGDKTVPKIAEKLGVNYHTLRNWAKERSDIPTSELIKIAELTNVSLNWLLTGQGDMYLLGSKPDFDLEKAVEKNDDWLGVIDDWYDFEGLKNPMPEAMGASFMGGWADMDREKRLAAIRDFKSFLDLTFETSKAEGNEKQPREDKES